MNEKRAPMPTAATDAEADLEQAWAPNVHRVLKSAGVTHMSYVPDAGHASLIDLFTALPPERYRFDVSSTQLRPKV